MLVAGDVALDPARRTVHRADRPVELTRKEFGVLEVLLGAGGAVVSSEELLERVWDENADPFTTTVRVTVMTLRKKLGEPGRDRDRGRAPGYRVPGRRADRPWPRASMPRATARAPGLPAPAARCCAPRWSRWSARCCCGWAGCWSAGSRTRARAAARQHGRRRRAWTCRPSRSARPSARPRADEVLRAGLIAFPLVVIAAAVVSWGLVGRVLGPLHEVTATARRLSAESLDTRPALRDARGEVAELAAGFDAMLDRLQAAFDAQRRFVANASHELRTPLSVLRTEVDVTLADPDADVDELRRMGAVVRDATRRADDLVAGLLLLARTEARRPSAAVAAGGPGRRRRARRWPRSAPRPAARGLRVQRAPAPGARPAATRCCSSGWRQPAGERRAAQRRRRLGRGVHRDRGPRSAELCVGLQRPGDRRRTGWRSCSSRSGAGPVERTGAPAAPGWGCPSCAPWCARTAARCTAEPVPGGGLTVTVHLPTP